MSDINQTAFSAIFQQNPNYQAFLGAFQNSPALVDLINTFAAKATLTTKVQITLGEPGKGTFTSGDGNTITIDPNMLPGSTGSSAESFEVFAATLAHELGHATQPDGLPNKIATDPTQAGQIGPNAEGVALYSEYQVAQQLGVTMHSDGAYKGSTFQQTLNQLAQQDAQDPAQFRTDAIATGADYYSNNKPSSPPNLNYSQYYQDGYIINQLHIPGVDASTVD